VVSQDLNIESVHYCTVLITVRHWLTVEVIILEVAMAYRSEPKEYQHMRSIQVRKWPWPGGRTSTAGVL